MYKLEAVGVFSHAIQSNKIYWRLWDGLVSKCADTLVLHFFQTVCLIGVAERYKELAKYNVRQLTSATT